MPSLKESQSSLGMSTEILLLWVQKDLSISVNGQCEQCKWTAPEGAGEGDFEETITCVTWSAALPRKKGNKTAENVWTYAFIYELRRNRSRYQFVSLLDDFFISQFCLIFCITGFREMNRICREVEKSLPCSTDTSNSRYFQWVFYSISYATTQWFIHSNYKIYFSFLLS